tara:strand:- start:54 stop:512 length:459 start_codon:yes stop_codon:yes gene_type:complete
MNNALQRKEFSREDAVFYAENYVNTVLSESLRGVVKTTDLVGVDGNLDVSLMVHMLNSRGYRARLIERVGVAIRLAGTHDTNGPSFILVEGGHFIAVVLLSTEWYIIDSLNGSPERIGHNLLVHKFLTLSTSRGYMARRVVSIDEPLFSVVS